MSTLADMRELGTLTKTRNDRIMVGNFGRGNWRLVCQDDDGDWAVTGYPCATKLEAMSMITETERTWFA